MPILYLKRQHKVHPAKRFEILKSQQHWAGGCLSRGRWLRGGGRGGWILASLLHSIWWLSESESERDEKGKVIWMKLAVKKREGVHQKADSVHILKKNVRKGESWSRTRGIQARWWQLSNRAASFYLFVQIGFQLFSSTWSLRRTTLDWLGHLKVSPGVTRMLSHPCIFFWFLPELLTNFSYERNLKSLGQEHHPYGHIIGENHMYQTLKGGC